jgi:adenosylhomocysteine nucleosidase
VSSKVSVGRSAALSVIAVTGLAIEARIAAGAGVRALAGGGVAQQLAAALEREIAQGAGAVISFGIAGGLAQNVAPGTWIVARAVVTSTANWPCDPVWTHILAERLQGALTADVAGVDEPVIDAAHKRALHLASGAVALDTESHIAARIAAEHRLPFAVFRVVADPAHRNLPAAAAQALKVDGTINGREVLRSLARRPGQLPLMLRTAVDASTAFRALSRGRRLLGPRLGCPDFNQLLLDVP